MKKEFENRLTTALYSSPIVYIPHFHYSFVDEVLESLITPKKGKHKRLELNREDIVEFDNNRGIVDFFSKKSIKNLDSLSEITTFLTCLVEKRTFSNEKIFVFKNFGEVWNNTNIQTYLQTFASIYEKDMRHSNTEDAYDPLTTILIVSPEPISQIPPQMEKITTVVELDAPSQEEVMAEVCKLDVTKDLQTEQQIEAVRTALCRTLQGLQLYEVRQILKSASVLTRGVISLDTVKYAQEGKKQIVKKSGIVEVVDADVHFADIGGLEVIKRQLEEKKEIFLNLDLAEKCNLPIPKGILIIGMPGCGKSMIAKSVAHLFGMSLLRLDISRLMGQYVGQSEANLRNALMTAEAAHPCVLWIDEIEKAFAGSNGGNHDNDMLVMRLMGHFLTWMQERRTPVYIVATANDVMRPEFMRKGRFDEVYFVDFPNHKERLDIFTKKINKFKNNEIAKSVFDFSTLDSYDEIVKDMVGTTDHGFSGAEIESLVNTIMNRKFLEYIKLKNSRSSNDHSPVPAQEITKQDFLDEIKNMKPSVMASQTSKPINQEDQLREKTNVERIRDLKETYNFTPASETSKP